MNGPTAGRCGTCVCRVGGKVDLAVIEDGRICGIFFWNAASDRSALVHLVTAAKAYLAEIWVLSTPAAVGELRGCLPLHVGFRVAKPGIVPALAMPATIGKPGVSDLLSLLHVYELRQLAASLDVSPSTTAVGAGRPAGVRQAQVHGDDLRGSPRARTHAASDEARDTPRLAPEIRRLAPGVGRLMFGKRQLQAEGDAGPWGSRSGRDHLGWRRIIPPRVRAGLVGQSGAIQRLSRFLLRVALISGAAVIVPPLLGASTVLTLACLSFFSAGVLGYLSWIHDAIEGRQRSAASKRRKRIIWFAAATWMVGVLLTALVVLPTPEAPSPALPEITETR